MGLYDIVDIIMEVPVGDLLIRDISDAMKRKLAERAEKSGRSLSDEAKRLMQKGMTTEDAGANDNSPSAWDSLRSILGPESDDEGDAFAKIMDEIEAERKRDFGRSVEDFE
jgi:plasmid stability protein